MDSKLLNRLKTYFSGQPIERVWLFGSFSRGEEEEHSDLDFLVEFRKGCTIGLQYFRIINDLKDISHREVDLAEVDMLDHRVRKEVDKDKILIYERAQSDTNVS